MAYEYKKIKSQDGTHYLSENEFNELGEQNWMLICYNDMEDSYIFLKEKQDE